ANFKALDCAPFDVARGTGTIEEVVEQTAQFLQLEALHGAILSPIIVPKQAGWLAADMLRLSGPKQWCSDEWQSG
ncbi:unnamed protein product, partial [Ilex paraguariensis]